MKDHIRRLWTALKQGTEDQKYLSEKQALLDRPWEEDFLHFGLDGSIHGRFVPPNNRRLSTTADGWCTGVMTAGLNHRGIAASMASGSSSYNFRRP
jgi:hypothetical protein